MRKRDNGSRLANIRVITLYLRYTIATQNKLSDFATYAAEEQIPIRESAIKLLGIICPPISPERLAKDSV